MYFVVNFLERIWAIKILMIIFINLLSKPSPQNWALFNGSFSLIWKIISLGWLHIFFPLWWSCPFLLLSVYKRMWYIKFLFCFVKLSCSVCFTAYWFNSIGEVVERKFLHTYMYNCMSAYKLATPYCTKDTPL